MTKPPFLKKGGFVFPIIFVLVGFFIFNFVFAYGSKNTHPALTYEAGRFYNMNAGLDSRLRGNDSVLLSEEDIDALMQGARDEDIPPRWINHFYNPVTGSGWTADKLGDIDSGVIEWFSKFALSSRDPISAKNWAKNIGAQSDYSLYGGNQTWQRAIDLYLAGDRAGAFKALGHTLHLLEDMAVPDHTRNDTHAGLAGDKGSPYETWAESYTTGKEKSLAIAEDLQKQNIKPLNLLVLEDYFDVNANYSSKNFFSEDTIIEGINPAIFDKKDNGDSVIVFVKNGTDIYPAVKYPHGNENIKEHTTNDSLILSAYWERLSKQAVISGAGVINLFFKEVEEQKKMGRVPNIEQPKKIGTVSIFGELAKLNKNIVQAITTVQEFAMRLLPQQGKTQTAVDINELSNVAPRQSSGDKNSSGIAASLLDKLGTPRNDTKVAVSAPAPTGEKSSPIPFLQRGEDENLYVSRVIDGDTITLNNGKDVRLIGMDTPELGEKCSEEAKKYLENFVLGKTVRLEKDTSETDKYNRLLRYVYIGEVFVNAEMVKDGYAELMQIPPDTKYKNAFKALEDEAKFFKRGCLYDAPHLTSPRLQGEEKEVGGATDSVEKTEDRGPYYGGSSYAGNPAPPANNEENEPATAALQDNSPTATAQETATSTPEVIIPPDTTSSSSTSSTSTPTESEPAPSQDKILISEAQIAGGAADDEFIELYNPNNKIVSLAGWSIQYRGSAASSFSKKNFTKDAKISAYGFYLIAHKNYSVSSTADMVHSTFSLSNDGGSIFLVRATTTLQTGAEDFISDRVAYYKGSSSTSSENIHLFPETEEINIGAGEIFERKSNASSTAETMAQGGINETDGNAEDTDNNKNDFIIQAVANPQNTSSLPEDPASQHYPPLPPEVPPPPPPPPPPPKILCETQNYDSHKNYEGEMNKSNALPLPIASKNQTVTLLANQTYYVDCFDCRIVEKEATLIIPEGVVIKFGRWRQGTWSINPLYFLVDGSLEINGTKENPVIFTTFRDDSHGVPINMAASAPAPYDWGALQIESNSQEKIKIQNAKFYYGGGSGYGAIYLNMAKADIKISDIEIMHSGIGLYARGMGNALLEIINGNFEYNNAWGAILDTENSAGAAKFINNIFKCNGDAIAPKAGGGLFVKYGAKNITIENNNFLGNKNFGVYYNKNSNKPETLTAQNNYWNDASGPYNATANPTGAGDPVSDYVNFTPFKSSPASP